MVERDGTHVSPVALLGRSPAIVALRAEIASAARTHAKVLITGETGAGKEVVSRLIHYDGTRRTRRFVAVNCSGIPETLLESELFGHIKGSFTGAYRDKPGLVKMADGGTLFLDELGEMSLRMQAVLLRFAETGEVQPVGADGASGRANVRLITATHRDLRARITAGDFREDLYYRLNVIQIHVPALRERGDDVRMLLHHFLAEAAAAHSRPVPRISPAAEDRLLAYNWPGNVRELKNVTERLVVRGGLDAVAAEDLPAEVRRAHSGPPVLVGAPIVAASSAPIPDHSATTGPERLWARMQTGESFWTVVQQPFKAHDITRADVRALVALGLEHTQGSYRQLVAEFQLPPRDYKRFLAFLSQHDCHLRFQRHRFAARPGVSATPATDAA
jgi:DNA-binding NtrC family response regulator